MSERGKHTRGARKNLNLLSLVEVTAVLVILIPLLLAGARRVFVKESERIALDREVAWPGRHNSIHSGVEVCEIKSTGVTAKISRRHEAEATDPVAQM